MWVQTRGETGWGERCGEFGDHWTGSVWTPETGAHGLWPLTPGRPTRPGRDQPSRPTAEWETGPGGGWVPRHTQVGGRVGLGAQAHLGPAPPAASGKLRSFQPGSGGQGGTAAARSPLAGTGPRLHQAGLRLSERSTGCIPLTDPWRPLPSHPSRLGSPYEGSRGPACAGGRTPAAHTCHTPDGWALESHPGRCPTLPAPATQAWQHTQPSGSAIAGSFILAQ